MWEFPLCAVITINEQRNCLGLLIGQNLGRHGKLGCMLGGRRVESERHYGATKDRHAVTLLVGHDLVVMNRLIEMG